MAKLGTPLSPSATRVLLLGSGELGKEVAIELQRLGVEVIAADRYADAPAMQVAHRSHVIDMLDAMALRALIAQEQPHLVVPEIEAIHTETLVQLEQEQGLRVIPTARAARLTMDREGIRRLAAETLGLPTSPSRLAATDAASPPPLAATALPLPLTPALSSPRQRPRPLPSARALPGPYYMSRASRYQQLADAEKAVAAGAS